MFRNKAVLPLVLLLATTLISGCFESKTVVKRVKPHIAGSPQPKLNGVFFSLPRTVVKIDLPVVRASKKAGQFFRLSPFFFSGESFIRSKGTTIAPTPLEPKLDQAKEEGLYYGLDDPKFSTRGEPDPNQTFMVDIRGGKFETKTLLLEVTEDGIIAKAEAESKNEAIDFFTQGLKTAVSITAPLVPFSGLSAQAHLATIHTVHPENKSRCEVELEAVMTPTERMLYDSMHPSYRAFLETNIGFCYLARLGNGEVGEEKRRFFWNLGNKQIEYYTHNFGTATTEGFPDPAADLPRGKIAYDRIQELIQKRADLVSSPPQPGSPAETLTAKLKEVDTYIKGYKQAYFLGVSDQETWVGNFEYVPPTSPPYVLGLLSYSERNGICSITGGGGPKGVQPPAKFMTTVCDAGKTVLLQLNTAASQMSSNVKAGNFDESGERGFYYRVPAKVSATLCENLISTAPINCTDADEIGRDELSVAQLGQMASLPASTGGRRSSYKLVYYSSTGAIQTFNIASDSLVQKSNLSDIDSAATELRDAKTEKLKRDTERLKAEKDLLDAKKALKEAKEANSNSNSNSSP